MKISYYQMDIIFKDIEANIKKVKNSLKKLEKEMLILPELFNTGYMYPANFGGKDSLDFLRIRALENNVFIVTCNRVENKKGNVFDAFLYL